MAKNKQIIAEFEKLIRYINSEIDNETDKKKKLVNIFRLKQLSQALEIIKKYPKTIKKGSDLKGIKGIGEGTINRIDEILNDGKLSEVQTLDNDISKYVQNLKEIYGIGDVKARELVNEYGIKTVSELKKAHRDGVVKLNDNVLVGLKYAKLYKQKIPRSEVKKMQSYLKRTAKKIDDNLHAKLCGSFRRKKPFSNDIDCLLTHTSVKSSSDMKKNKNFLYVFVKLLKKQSFIVDALTGYDVDTKFMGFCRLSADLPIRRIDIRYMPFNAYPAALLYFTGSGTFNQNMRRYAKKEGFKLNEYGLYKKSGDKYKHIDVANEKDIFSKLNLPYVKPKDRN